MVDKKTEVTTTESGIESRAKRPARRSVQYDGKLKKIDLPGYYVRYINTDELHHAYRFEDLKERGYEAVLRKEVLGDDCARPNEPFTVSDPCKPMAVKLPVDYRAEDLDAKQKLADEKLGRALAHNLGETGNSKVSRGPGTF